MCCQPRRSTESAIVALVVSAAVVAMVANVAVAAAQALTTAVAAVVTFLVTVGVTTAVASTLAAVVYLAARTGTAVARAIQASDQTVEVPQLGPGAIAALPSGDTGPAMVLPVIADREVA